MRSTILFCAALMVGGMVFAAPPHPWEVHTLTFTARGSYDNPYASIPVNGDDDLLVVTFTGITGEAQGKTMAVRGCWNGKKEWIVNFAPPAPGKWRYRSASAD